MAHNTDHVKKDSLARIPLKHLTIDHTLTMTKIENGWNTFSIFWKAEMDVLLHDCKYERWEEWQVREIPYFKIK